VIRKITDNILPRLLCLKSNNVSFATKLKTAAWSTACVIAIAGCSSQVAQAQTATTFTDHQLTVKVNTVGVALLMANAAVEYQFAPRFSVEIPIYYSNLDYFSHNAMFKIFAVQPEVRYWFDSKAQMAVGAHVGVCYYNMATNAKYAYQTYRQNHPMLGGGLSFVYRKHFGAESSWGIECELGVGVYSNERDRYLREFDPNNANAASPYTPYRTHNNEEVKVYDSPFIGIDRVAVSITYTFDLSKR
jgi:hypothetical protein